jgi:hypothetical protein
MPEANGFSKKEDLGCCCSIADQLVNTFIKVKKKGLFSDQTDSVSENQHS